MDRAIGNAGRRRTPSADARWPIALLGRLPMALLGCLLMALLACLLPVLAGARAATPRAPARPASASAFPSSPAVFYDTCSAAQLAARPAPIIHRGLSAPAGRPVPLLIALHSWGGGASDMEGLTQFAELADQAGFAVVFPTACDTNATGQPWDTDPAFSYLTNLIDQLVSNTSIAGPIDPSRIYATGFSAGGDGTWDLACELSTRIAAVAVVSDAIFGSLYDSCAPARPLPQLLMVGTNDSFSYAGTPGMFPGAEQTTTLWRRLDGCTNAPPRLDWPSTVQERYWSSCTDGTAVALDLIQGAGHVWPPAGMNAPQDYPTSQRVWSFLSSFSAAPLTFPAADGRIVAVRVVRRGKHRKLLTTISSREPLTVTETLPTKDGRGLRVTFMISQTGAHTQQLFATLPQRVASGVRRITIAFRDRYGRYLSLTRQVKLP